MGQLNAIGHIKYFNHDFKKFNFYSKYREK